MNWGLGFFRFEIGDTLLGFKEIYGRKVAFHIFDFDELMVWPSSI